MKTLLLLLSLLLYTYNSYAQSIEIVWEKKLDPDEKFLAISKNHTYILTRKINDYFNTTLYLFEIKSKKLIDTIFLKEKIVTTGEFSPDDSYIVCSDMYNTKWFILKPMPLSILKNAIGDIHPSQNFFSNEKVEYDKVLADFEEQLGKPIIRFDDNSDSTGWFTYETPYESPTSRTSKSLFQRVNWLTGKVINIFDVGAYPLTLETLPNQSGVTSFLLYESSHTPLGAPDTYTSESYVGLWKENNDSLFYTKVKDKYLGTPQLTYKGSYLLYRNALLDIINQQAFMINDTTGEIATVLAKSKYHIQFSGSSIFPFHLRSIRNIKKVYPVSTKFYQCTQLISCYDSSHFLSFSKDGILRLSRIDYKEGIPDEKFLADFQPAHNVSTPYDKVKFFNKSFPLETGDTFFWDFGDGKTDTERDPIHQYEQGGEYTVTLKVTNSQGKNDSIIKKNVIKIISIDSNIVRSKKIWKTRLPSIEYTPDGKNLICSDGKNSLIVQRDNLLTTDSILNDIHEIRTIGGQDNYYYVTIRKGSRIPTSGACYSPTNGKEVIFNARIRRVLREQPIDSFIISGVGCDMDAGKEIETLKTVKINDSIFGLMYYAKNIIYSGPPSVPHTFEREFEKNINISKKNIIEEFNEEIFNSHRPGKTQFVPPHYILSEKGLKDLKTQKFISNFNFKTINDFAVIDGDHFLAATNDLVSTIVLFNAKGDTLDMIRSATGAQISIDINPVNRNEFATTDYNGNVTIWKIPTYKDKPTKLVEIDFAANYIKNITNTVQFEHRIFPFRLDGSLEWNFGDGQISNEISPVHTYDKPGIYSVSMRYTTPYGIDTTIVKSNIITIKLIPNIIDFSSSHSTIRKNDTVLFNNLTIPFTNNFSYEWDFGDGTTSTEIHPLHIYKDYGMFTVKLSVKSADRSDTVIIKNNYITVKPILNVMWKEIPEVLAIGDTLHLSVLVEPNDYPSSVEWDMGTSEKLLTPILDYLFPLGADSLSVLGIRKIKLAVKMDTTTYKEERSLTIVPKIKIITSHSEAFINKVIYFRANILPTTGSYSTLWLWGDSTYTENVYDPQHQYKEKGLYSVSLKVNELNSQTKASAITSITILQQQKQFTITPSLSEGEPIYLHWYGSNGTISIQSLTGETVRLFQYSGGTASHHLQWNLDDHYQNRLPPGLYYCTLKDSYGLPLSNPVFILY